MNKLPPLIPLLNRCKHIMADRSRMVFLRNSIVGIALAFLVGAAGVAEFRQHYRLGLDLSDVRCLPERVYWVKLGVHKPLSRGEVVAFIPPHGLMVSKFEGKVIAKMIAGLPGDVVKVEHDRAYVNGKFIGALVLNKKLGRNPGGFDRVEIVPAGKVFLVGTLPRSYDGRYWGAVDSSTLIGTVTPLI